MRALGQAWQAGGVVRHVCWELTPERALEKAAFGRESTGATHLAPVFLLLGHEAQHQVLCRTADMLSRLFRLHCNTRAL